MRKGSNVPYISHLLGVASIALENGADEEQAIAALLHDAVEDQGGAERLADIQARFGERVARIVNDCTDTDQEPKPPWRERKEEYIASLTAKPRDSLEVSLADKTHNATAILRDLQVVGNQIWDRFTGGRDGSLWYYRTIADAFAQLIPGPAADRLMHTVSEMVRLSNACTH